MDESMSSDDDSVTTSDITIDGWVAERHPDDGVLLYNPDRSARIHIRGTDFADGPGYLADLWAGTTPHSVKQHQRQVAAHTIHGLRTEMNKLLGELT